MEKRPDIEIAKPGHANGISLQLHAKQQTVNLSTLDNYDPDFTNSLTEAEKKEIIENAAEKFGEFLDALGCDWRNDPNSDNTPMRVAKAYVNDLWAGRYELPPKITGFPSDGYDGVTFEGGIPLTSMCSHHHGLIQGQVHIAYIPTKDTKVIGLSKLNRIVEHFGRRGAIQEQLTVAIHNAVNQVTKPNLGVAVMVEATHACVSCRGVKHKGASMKTSKLSGSFMTEDSARAEFYKFIDGYKVDK